MIKCNKGFSLVEVIVAMAIISIVVAVSVSLFSQGTLGIYVFGEKSKGLFDAQGYIEEQILLPNPDLYEDDDIIVYEDMDLELSFYNPDNEVDIITIGAIAGKRLIVNYEYEDNRTVTLTYFISNNNNND